MKKNPVWFIFCSLFIFLFAGCADTHHRIIVSVSEQKMLVLTDGKPVATYKVSTSKYGTGDRVGSYATPLGHFCIRKKIGDGAQLGAVFHSGRPTGEVVLPNAPGRDPVVTRILWLQGLESQNRHAYDRCIYIHGTPQEALLGKPASFGCIRMSSVDVAKLYDLVGRGTRVEIIEGSLGLLK
jgi:lipoprotein-anchoring transpeptidase ErfK/SrfK